MRVAVLRWFRRDRLTGQVAVGLVGALTSLFMGYLEGTIVVPRETLVQHCVELVERAGRG